MKIHSFETPALVRLWSLDEITRIEALYGKDIAGRLSVAFNETAEWIIAQYAKKYK